MVSLKLFYRLVTDTVLSSPRQSTPHMLVYLFEKSHFSCNTPVKNSDLKTAFPTRKNSPFDYFKEIVFLVFLLNIRNKQRYNG